jgi:VWFA-related protein
MLAAMLMGAPWVAGADPGFLNVPCSVRDRHGAIVTDLKQDDFEIRLDGKRQAITHFTREVDAPVTVALLLDVTAGKAPIIGAERAAARRFVEEVLRPADRALLGGFARSVAVLQELTSSKEMLLGALERTGAGALPPGDPKVGRYGGTLLYDAVEMIASLRLRTLPGLKAIILISDGMGDDSVAKIADAVRAAQDADAAIYGIYYDDDEPFGNGIAALELLTWPTGGRAFELNRKKPLGRALKEIAEELHNRFELRFSPPDDAGKRGFHRLEVKCTKPGLKAQARTGYYTPAK